MVSSLPSEIVSAVELQTNTKVKGFSYAGGGCINHGGKLITTNGVYFLKWNDRKRYPGMLVAEAKGLTLLRASASLSVPDVQLVFEAGERQFLMLEYINAGDRNDSYWRDFGSGLAKLHQHSSNRFGLDHHNFIGSLTQDNTELTSWTEFFIEKRLSVQLRLAMDSRKLNAQALKMFEKFFVKLGSLLPDEPPALLHGDLWGGNVIVTSQGDPCLIDPAVYFGNREMDLAMTALFGGFNPLYYETYNEIYPLQPGWNERLDIYNLYPLLVHVNLFGGSYAVQTLSILKRFV